MLKWLDIPPVWLIGALLLAWVQGRYLDVLSLAHPVVDLLGGLLVGGGLLLMLMAVVEMRRARTTVIPHLQPTRLVTSGIFRRTRNPIYLGDVLVLAGLILRWDAVLSLPLVPVFAWIIERRFILAEESRLERAFGREFALYRAQTRRWI